MARKRKRFRSGSTPVVPEVAAASSAVADEAQTEAQPEAPAPVETEAPTQAATEVEAPYAAEAVHEPEAFQPHEVPQAAASSSADADEAQTEVQPEAPAPVETEAPTQAETEVEATEIEAPYAAEAVHEPEALQPHEVPKADEAEEPTLGEPVPGAVLWAGEGAPAEAAAVADWVQDAATDGTPVGEPVEPFLQEVAEAPSADEMTDGDDVAPAEPAPAEPAPAEAAPAAFVADGIHDAPTDDIMVREPVEPFAQELVDAAHTAHTDDRLATAEYDPGIADVAVVDELGEEPTPEPLGEQDDDQAVDDQAVDEHVDLHDGHALTAASVAAPSLVDAPAARAAEPAATAAGEAPALTPLPRPVHGTAAWRRLVRMGLPRATKANVLGALLAVLLGLAIATQVQLTQERGLSQLSQTDLVRVLDDVSLRSSRLDAQIRELEATRDRLRSGTGSSAEALEQAQKRVDTLGILAGTTAATGPGVVITLSDPENALTAPVILDLIQELRDAGAEAIDVGGVRVVASTFVGEQDGEITIDGVPVTRPIEVKAIGDAKTLSSAMTIPGGIVETVRQKQASATVTEEGTVEITSLHEPEDPKNARVVK